MKVLNVTVLMLMLMISASVSAQEEANFFVGKWDLLVEGLPSEDVHILVNISSTDDGLVGEMTMGEKVQKVEIEQTEDDMITLKFEAQGYDVSVNLAKKDENSVEGDMMGMFDITGKRVTDEKKAKEPKKEEQK
jgi:hypothetical protein